MTSQLVSERKSELRKIALATGTCTTVDIAGNMQAGRMAAKEVEAHNVDHATGGRLHASYRSTWSDLGPLGTRRMTEELPAATKTSLKPNTRTSSAEMVTRISTTAPAPSTLPT